MYVLVDIIFIYCNEQQRYSNDFCALKATSDDMARQYYVKAKQIYGKKQFTKNWIAKES